MLTLDITKQLARFSLRVQTTVAPAFTALFGPSGAGKTTVLNLIAGLDDPDSGEISLDGRILFSSARRVRLKPQARPVGYVFQESRLFPHLTIRENLEFGLKRVPAHERKFSFKKTVAVARLDALLERLPAALSGGEKQRAALARAILASPDYLLMDEPLAALDLPARLSFLRFLREVHEALGLPILYVSHDLANVIKFADEIVLLEDGKVRGQGTPGAVLEKMRAAPLVAAEDVPNLLEVTVQAHDDERKVTFCATSAMRFLLPRIERNVSETLLLNIPASEIIISVNKPTGLSASNIYQGSIVRIVRLGERVLVDVDAGETFTVEIVEATVRRLELKPGKVVFLIFKASAFRRL